MSIFRRTQEKTSPAIRHVVGVQAYDHDCEDGHGPDCQVVDQVQAVVWEKAGRQLTAGAEFDRLEAAYRGNP